MTKGKGGPAESLSPLFPVVGGDPWISQGIRPGHVAVDIAADLGSPIIAPTSGIITREQRNRLTTGYGTALWMRTDQGRDLIFGHLEDEYVSVGQQIRRGEQIGILGSTGYSTGPHLHLEGGSDILEWLQGAQPLSRLAAELPTAGKAGKVSVPSGLTLNVPAPVSGRSGVSYPADQIVYPTDPISFTEYAADPARNKAAVEVQEADESELMTSVKRGGFILAGGAFLILGIIILAWAYKEPIIKGAGTVIKGATIAGAGVPL